MKRLWAALFITLMLVLQAGFVKPAHAIMPEAEAKNIVATSYKAVQDCLDALEAANKSGDVQQIDQALKALNLSINNYAVADESLASLQAGTLKNDSTLTTSYLIAEKLSIYSFNFINKNFKSAWFFYTDAQRLGIFLPSSANLDEIPAGLDSLKPRIVSASAEAVSTLRKAGVYNGKKNDEGSEGKLGINTHVGSPI